MEDNQKPVAKSLHTIKVIQQVAAAHQHWNPELSRPDCVKLAMQTLGLDGRPDPYGLEEKALRLWK